jgi:hypothetical protein
MAYNAKSPDASPGLDSLVLLTPHTGECDVSIVKSQTVSMIGSRDKSLKIKAVRVDTDSLRESLLRLNAVHPLNALPENALRIFIGLMFGQTYGDIPKLKQRTEFLPAGPTSDEGFIWRIFWDADIVTAAFAAFQAKISHMPIVRQAETPQRIYTETMKPLPAPDVPGSTPWERMSNGLKAVLRVPKEEIVKQESKEKRKREKRMKEQKRG